MALANQSASQGATGTPSGESQGSITAIAAGGGPVHIPDAAFLFNATFEHAGSDLKLIGPDGHELLITNYFGAGAPSLLAPNHAMLDGQTVTLLAGPQYPGQYAQAGPAQQAASPIGKVETLQGEVTAQHADGTSQTLKVGDPVFESDVVSTGQGSVIGMKLSDGTLLSLQESSKLTINDFVYQPDGDHNSALVNVIQGTFSLLAGQVAPTGDMKIQTPIATMGIRGTSILGVNVDAILGHLSLTNDPNGHVGFIEVFNNLNGNLFTVLRTVFEKITVSENGLLSITPKTPEELGIDQTLTQLLHDFYSQVPKTGPDETPHPQSGSHRFTTPNIQEIDFDNTPPPPDGTELLLPANLLEQFIEFLLQIEEIRDEIILALQSDPAAGSVVLDDQLEGSDADAGAGEGGDPVDTTLPFDFGSSGPGHVGFASLNGKPVVDANGDPVTNGGDPLTYLWDPATNTLRAVEPGGPGTEDDKPIFSIVVNPATGEVTVSIIGAVDHLGVNGESLSIDVPFTVQAANGATVTGILTVGIDDDVPMFSNPDGVAPGVSNAGVDEDDVAMIAGLQPPGTDGGQASSASGELKVDFGADGFGSTEFTAFEVPNGNSSALTPGGDGVESGLTSDGETVFFRLSGDGQTVEGYVEGQNGEQVILRATLNENDAGYEVELLGNIDHQPGDTGRGAGQSINFTVAAADGDGDSIDVTLSARITDDAPVVTGDGNTNAGLHEAYVDVADMQSPGTDAAHSSSVSGNIGKVDFGADGFGSMSFSGAFNVPNENGGTLTAGDMTGLDSGMTSNGEPVFFRLSADGLTIEGFVPASENNGVEKTILQATLDGGDSGYTIDLFGNIDHQPGDTGRGAGQSINFTVAAADGDGDTVDVNLSVRVTDNAPVAHGDVAEVGQQGNAPADSNVILLLDRSYSMGYPSGDGETLRFDLAKTAAMTLLTAAGLNQALVIDFADDANASGWGSPEDAQNYIDTHLQNVGGDGTDLDGALAQVVNEYGNADPADHTYIYVISDGGASHDSGIPRLPWTYTNGDDVNFGEEVLWKILLAAGQVDGVFGYSVGDNGEEQLTPVTWDPETWAVWHPWTDGPDVVQLDDPNQLLDHFYDQIGYEAPTAEGNVLTGDGNIPGTDGSDDAGADGLSHISSVVIDGETYTDPGQDHYSITELTEQGGEFTFHFAGDGEGSHLAGDWEYTAPLYGNTLPYENIQYTIQDGDGDTSTSNLIIEIEPDVIDQVVFGTEGDDTLTGMAQDTEVLVGGTGADTFALNSFEVQDYVADYNSGEGDTIDLTALLDGVTADNYESFVRIDERGDGAVDALQVNTGSEQQPNFVDVATLNGDAGVNVIIQDGGAPQHVDNPSNIA